MRKFITLSLMAAGLMAFSASAAMPEEKVFLEGQQIMLNREIKNPEISILNQQFINSSVRKAPSKISPVEAGMLQEGMYGLNARRRFQKEGKLVTQIIGLMTLLERSEVENEYLWSIFGFTDVQNGQMPNPIKVKYDPNTKILTVPANQIIFTEQDKTYGTLNFSLMNYVEKFIKAGEEEGITKDDIYTMISTDTDFHFYLNGDQFESVVGELPNETNRINNDTGVFTIGAPISEESVVTYGYFIDPGMSVANATASTTLMTQEDTYSYNFYPQVIYDNTYKFEIRGFAIPHTYNNPIVFGANKDTKLLKSLGLQQPLYSLEIKDTEEVFMLADIESADYLPTATISVTEKQDEDGVYYPTTFTFSSLTTVSYPTGYTDGNFTNTNISINLTKNLFDVIAIEGVESDLNNADAPVQYFDLQGRKVNGENLSNGIYVRRQGTDVQKVFVK